MKIYFSKLSLPNMNNKYVKIVLRYYPVLIIKISIWKVECFLYHSSCTWHCEIELFHRKLANKICLPLVSLSITGFERIAGGIKNKISGRKNISLWSMRNRLKREIPWYLTEWCDLDRVKLSPGIYTWIPNVILAAWNCGVRDFTLNNI